MFWTMKGLYNPNKIIEINLLEGMKIVSGKLFFYVLFGGFVVKAVWNGQLLAESDDTVLVEGNHYFPNDSVKWDYFTKSDYQTHCPWKGMASYYNVEVNGDTNQNAAWYYPTPSDAAKSIKDHVAFWHGVQVTK